MILYPKQSFLLRATWARRAARFLACALQAQWGKAASICIEAQKPQLRWTPFFASALDKLPGNRIFWASMILFMTHHIYCQQRDRFAARAAKPSRITPHQPLNAMQNTPFSFLASDRKGITTPRSIAALGLVCLSLLPCPTFAEGKSQETEASALPKTSSIESLKTTLKDSVWSKELADTDPLLQELFARQKDLGDAMDATMPLRPHEIKQAKHQREAYEEALSPHPASLGTQTKTLSMPPTGTPPVVHLTYGYSSTLLFQDRSGRPWPISRIVVGNPKDFSVMGPGSAKTKDDTVESTAAHMVNIVPLSDRASSNLAITLHTCPYPVIVHLITDSPIKEKRRSDALQVYRINQQAPGQAETRAMDDAVVTPLSESMLGFLHAIPDPKAKKRPLEGAGNDTMLWEMDDKLYLRTRHSLIWPAWLRAAKGEDVMIYVIPKTHHIVLSVHGRSKTLSVLGD